MKAEREEAGGEEETPEEEAVEEVVEEEELGSKTVPGKQRGRRIILSDDEVQRILRENRDKGYIEVANILKEMLGIEVKPSVVGYHMRKIIEEDKPDLSDKLGDTPKEDSLKEKVVDEKADGVEIKQPSGIYEGVLKKEEVPQETPEDEEMMRRLIREAYEKKKKIEETRSEAKGNHLNPTEPIEQEIILNITFKVKLEFKDG